MTDADLRELERRFRASGSVEDEVALLRERVRRGDLSQRNLELAAYLGSEAAARCGFPAIPTGTEPEGWMQVIRTASFTAYLRVLVAATRRWLPSPRGGRYDAGRYVSRIEDEICLPIVSGQTARVGPNPYALPSLERHLSEVAANVPSAELLAGIRGEVVRWLLGHGDPLRERVVARWREADA